jgi:hypothetical protein
MIEVAAKGRTILLSSHQKLRYGNFRSHYKSIQIPIFCRLIAPRGLLR